MRPVSRSQRQQHLWRVCAISLVLATACFGAQGRRGGSPPRANIHTIIPVECTNGYFEWQVLGFLYSHRCAHPSPRSAASCRNPSSTLMPVTLECTTQPALSALQKARDELMNLLSHAWKACIINRTCEHGPLHGWGACRRAGQAGPVTRLMSCTEQELRTYRCCTSCHGSL